MSDGDTAEIDALLALCSECRQPMLLVNGVAQTRVAFWKDSVGRARVTPHSNTCPIPPRVSGA